MKMHDFSREDRRLISAARRLGLESVVWTVGANGYFEVLSVGMEANVFSSTDDVKTAIKDIEP